MLYDMLDKTLYYGNVLIYTRNVYDQCMFVFKGKVDDARSDEDVWDYLTSEVDQWICGNKWMLIYVKNRHYEDRLERHYSHSDAWTKERHPYKSSYEVEDLLDNLGS